MLLVLRSAAEQGFIYSLVALALYLSYRTLDIADLTTDGTFTLGCAISATMTLAGHPLLGLVLAIAAGASAGGVTAVLQTKLGVPSILAGIITMTGLYSVNLAAMGSKSNLPMLKEENVFSMAQALFGSAYKLVVAGVFAAVCAVLLGLFLRTRLGLSIRATGDNRDMVSASSINPALMTTVGLCVANALTGLSGALLAQYQKFSDIGLGTWMVVIGLASLIIGEVVVGRGGILRGVLAAVIGAVVYRIIIALALSSSVDANWIKFFSAVIVAIAIAYPTVKEKVLFYQKRRREAKKYAQH